jgi:hypothetical protein
MHELHMIFIINLSHVKFVMFKIVQVHDMFF